MPNSQSDEDPNMQLVLGNSRFQPESSPPLSAAENSFAAMKNNFMKKIESQIPSKLHSGLSSVRRGTLDFDQSVNSGNVIIQGNMPIQSIIKTQRTDKDVK